MLAYNECSGKPIMIWVFTWGRTLTVVGRLNMYQVRRYKGSRKLFSIVYKDCCTLLHICHQRTRFNQALKKVKTQRHSQNSIESWTLFVNRLAVIAMLGSLTIFFFFGLFRSISHYMLRGREYITSVLAPTEQQCFSQTGSLHRG